MGHSSLEKFKTKRAGFIIFHKDNDIVSTQGRQEIYAFLSLENFFMHWNSDYYEKENPTFFAGYFPFEISLQSNSFFEKSPWFTASKT